MLGRFVQVYCDDILIFSKTREEHLVHVRMVLETLRHHKLYAKASKCQFGRSSVGFLGHVISERGVAVDPRKVAAVAEWATPQSCTDVRRFVGLANYYRKFVLRFSALAAPLTALCSPRARFAWGDAEQRSFDALKAALTSAPVLRVWDPARPTRLLTDASELAVSAILEQPDDAGAFHPVAFESRKLTLPERSYPPHLLELLAVVHALKTLRPYLLDKPFELHTDNASLQWLQQQRHVSHHQARWLNLLAEYQYRVVHIPGRTNPADFLTRKRFLDGSGPAMSTGYADPDSALELFAASAASPAAAFVHSGPEPDTPRFLHADFAAAVRAALPSDPELGPLAAAEEAGPAGGAFVLRDGLLYRRSPRGDRLCIPAAGDLRRTVLQELHATPLGGHFGRDKTLSLARRSVWWPGLPATVTEYVQTCPTCQRVKAEHLPPAGLLFPLPVPSRRGGCVSLDFMELPTAVSGHDFLQVHIDLLTGRVWLVPTFKTATAEVAARNFVGSVFRDVGLPDTIVSDRDTRFTSSFWTALHAALGASLIFGSPHHHNTTSKVERVNGVIADVLRAFAGNRSDDWPELVPLVEFAINDSASTLGSGYTPFYADRGQHPRRPLSPPDAPDAAAPPGSGEAAAHLMARITAEVRALLQEQQDRRKAALDARRRDVQLAIGDEVLLDTEHTPLPSRSLFSPRWMGPFTILAQTAPNTYLLDLPPAWRVVPEFNVERLRPYRRRPDHLGGDFGPPPPIPGADGRPEHEVAELLRFKMRYGRPHVLVRWAGRDASGDTWEPLDNLTNCEEAIAAFEQATGRPAGFTVDAAPPGDLGAPLVGRTLLYWWPDDGWQRGTVARTCPRGAFSHVVAYHRQTSALRGTADTLLDAATYGSRWVLLSPAPAAGVARALRPRAPRP
jgi:transposase InsO family protein